ncbi:DinB family protein [Acidicapsa ligni]|uniref:DinB family protein n=1 Tax=Acidicapsa ligni TaxID=542300 RepID=UPI0021DFF90A|nr:DinB family protein [Acidicapsa ligni]
MRKSFRFTSLNLIGCCLLAATSTFAIAQAAPAKPAVGTVISPAQMYDRQLSGMEKEIVGAAEAMPADKFNFAPTQGEFKGVRTFAGQVKHLAAANYYFFHDTTKPFKDPEADIEKLTSKEDIVKALKDSFAVAHAYISGITVANAFVMTENGTRSGTATMALAHSMDHYGQMVEYLRMNGIVPPASRGGM